MSGAIERGATCESCVFWQPASTDTRPLLGECRIYPPAVPSDIGPARWPTTRATDWCAEHGELASVQLDAVTH